MEFKQLVDISNVIWAAVVSAIKRMGIDLDLLLTNELGYVLANNIEGLMKEAGLYIATGTLDETIDRFIQTMKDAGFCQTSKIVKKTDDEIVVELGHCILATACENIRNNSKDGTSPCPLISILLGNLQKIKKEHFVDESKYNDETNTTTFTLRPTY